MSTRQARIWVGIDAGKGHHWAVAIDADGETVFSTKVINDEAQILTLIETARERANEVRWAVDISGRASTLLALLIAHGQQVVYAPGRTVNRMSGAYRGEGKTDARDARVIADQARMRPKDFAVLDTPAELVTTLQALTNYRADLIADRVRLVNRLHDLLVGICPPLPGPSRDYYLKECSEGLPHTQDLLALARRRVDVLWAMLCDKRLFTSAPPVTQTA
ncbi:IS110 family transposase [Streptomyces malaysiensis]|uniref:IS110 family transposase n=1 Tax=Streptomyces malaysiensis TaxID=92644 RepID=UPI00085336C6|nr:transposase [Streptomyces sp. SPMA113]